MTHLGEPAKSRMAEQQDRDQQDRTGDAAATAEVPEKKARLRISAELVGGLILMTGVLLFWGLGYAILWRDM